MNEFNAIWTAVEAIGPWRVLFEISVIYLLIYGFIVFCEGTRGAGVLKGLALSVIIAVVGTRLAVTYLNLERIGFLLTVITPAAFTAIIVILQPYFSGFKFSKTIPPFEFTVVNELVPLISTQRESNNFCAVEFYTAFV